MILTEGSFHFAGKNSVDDFGIYVRQYTPVVPPKRIRKLGIPLRNGAYNFGVKAYDEIVITLELFCDKDYERSEFREVSAWLANVGKLYFWDESDKFYKGEFESFPEYDEFTMLRMQPFKVLFVAYPFALGETKTVAIANGTNKVPYSGTAERPAYLKLTNTSGHEINGVQISLIFEED